MFWKIEEATGSGLFMLLDGLFDTEEQARAAIAKYPSNGNMRPALYQQGGWRGGPIRVCRRDEI